MKSLGSTPEPAGAHPTPDEGGAPAARSATQLTARERRRGLRDVVAASMAGTVVEWYEFFLYASAATLVFATQFFPKSDNQYDAIIAGFLTYAVGFIARPLGGIVFGHFGDKYGRKHLLQVSIVLVGVTTFAMGLIPTFDRIGYWAPFILVVLRFLQGFAVGGEWGGAVLLVAEHAPDESRGFWASWPQAAVPMGNLLATGVLYVLSNTLSDGAFLSWGWRVAFFLSAVIVIIGYYIRTRVTDAPIYQQAKAEHEQIAQAGYGVIEVLKRYPRGVFTAMGLRLAENVFYYIVVTFTITYLKVEVKTETKSILLLLLIAHAIHFVTVPLWGALTDRIGRRPVYAMGAVLASTWAFWAYRLFDTADHTKILFAVTVGLLFHGMMYAGQPALMAELFPTRMRYSGVSLGYQVTSLFAGSLAPIIATELLKNHHSSTPIAWYVAGCCVVTLVAVLVLRETKGSSLLALDAKDRADLGIEREARRVAAG